MSEPSRFRTALRWLFTPYGVTQRRALLVGLLLLAILVLGLMGVLR